MLSEQDQPFVTSSVRTGQIIVLALATGVLVFMALVFFVLRQPVRAGNQHILTPYIAVPMTIVALGLSLVVPRLITRSGLQQIARSSPPVPNGAEPSDKVKLVQIHLSTIIIGAAVTEGVGFFDVICYMLEGVPLAGALAVIMVIATLRNFPTQASVEAWLEQNLLQLEETRRAISL
jgi:hypothetical protein